MQRLIDDQDPVTANPMTGPEGLPADEAGPDADEYQLTEVARGRMLCIVHGRVCYRRVAIIGESEWVCPDERHRKPLRSS